MSTMDEVKDSLQPDQALTGTDADETVLLRRDSHTLRKNRRESRQRTPTALVSRAFDFLNEDVHSTVDVFENGSISMSQLSPVVDGEISVKSSTQVEALQDDACVTAYRSKDSGFASLERQLDKESIKTAFAEFSSESGKASHHNEAAVASNCISNLEEENAVNDNIKQSLEDTNSSLVSNVLRENENGSNSENIISEKFSKSDGLKNLTKPRRTSEDISSSAREVQEISDRVSMALKVLGDTDDTDEEHFDEEDKNCEIIVQVNDSLADNQLSGVIVSQRLSDEHCLTPKQDISSDRSEKNRKLTEHCDDSEESPLNLQSDVPVKESDVTPTQQNSDTLKETIAISNEGDIQNETSNVSDVKDEDGGVSKPDCNNENDTKIIKVERANQKESSSDDSSDEDTGIYAESFRRSNWIRVSKEGKLHLHLPTPPPSSSSTSSQQPPSTDSADDKEDVTVENGDEQISSAKPELDDVFEKPPSDWTHVRSDSIASTTSEAEFKRKYVSRRKCLIQRADSQQEYHRLSSRVYEQDKEVVLERNSECQDLGLHLLDSHPAFITSVDPGSLADKAGIVEGQILVSVNDYSVLTTSHEDIIDLIQKCDGSLSLGVANSDFQPVRDLQVPIISGFLYKLGNSSLMRMWKKRFFILRHDNCLYYYKNEQESDPLGALPLGGYTISRHTETNKDYCFKAEKYGARAYFFMTDSRDQMTEWVGAMTQAAARSKKRKESFLSVSSHNVSLPALDIRRPECSGFLNKMVGRSWNRRYCVLKDACIYYYKDVNSLSALGVAHLHGYTVDVVGHPKKRNSFSLRPPEVKMRVFNFSADNDTDKKRWVESLIHSIQRWVKVDN